MRIDATAHYVPEKVITNDDLSQWLETSDEWIYSRTGIHERHVVTTETNFDLSLNVAQQLLTQTNVPAADLAFIIVATMSPDYATPGEANRLQAAIGATQAFALNINVACSGFVYALELAARLLKTGQHGLVIGSEVLSRLVDWQDRRTAVLFADGAGGVLVSGDDQMPTADLRSFGDTDLALTAGQQAPSSRFTPAQPTQPFFAMDGRAVYQFAIREVPASLHRALSAAQLEPSAIDWYLLHQANARMLASIAKKLKVEPNRFGQNIEHYGNTSAASIAILLSEMVANRQIKRGDRLALAGFGGGLSVGSLILTY